MANSKHSMTEVLSPEEAKFLRNDSSKAGAAQPRVVTVAATADQKSPVSATIRRKPALTGTINNKVDERISNALLRASIERRINQEQPHLQRDILAEALAEWLTSRGYVIEEGDNAGI